jgi:hypothetical protein
MTAPDRTYDPVRFHRGSRGFAAFFTALNGFVVLGIALFVVPTLTVDPIVARWAVIVGVAVAIAHLAGVVGLIRGRRWSATLIGYVAAGGIAVSAFGALLALTGIEVFSTDRASTFGFFAWMIGTWAIAARWAFKPFTFTPQAHRVATPVGRPAPETRPSTGARKRTAVRPLAAAAA